MPLQGNTVTVEDTAILLTALATYQSRLDENDEHLSSELIPCLNRLRTALESQEDILNTLFSEVDFMTHIQSGFLWLSEDKRDEIKALGKAGIGSTSLSFGATAELIQKLVRNHISTTTEAGCHCHILINVILLHLASTMQSNESEVNIIPTFPIPQTMFETSLGKHSFSGVVDYLLASGPPKYSPFILGDPVETLANCDIAKYFTPAIIKVKKYEDLLLALAQAAIAAASYCKQHKLPVLRGCLTSGEEWWFFVYRCDDVASGAGGKISYSTCTIQLGSNLENLPLVLELLKDMVENALNYKQKYFSYI